jgi:hypothetical protein
MERMKTEKTAAERLHKAKLEEIEVLLVKLKADNRKAKRLA